jgi:hypothetical protein
VIRAPALGCFGAILFSLLQPLENQARAAPLAVTLEYAQDTGCPTVADFKVLVVDRLGYTPFVEGATTHVIVRMDRRGGAMDGHIEWRDSAGRWTGEQAFPSVSTDCLRLARAMAFALVVQIQLLATGDPAAAANGTPRTETGSAPEAPVSPAVRQAPPAVTPSAAPVESPMPTVAAVPPPPADGAPSLALGGGPSLALGMSSSPVALGRVFGALVWRHVAVEAAAMLSLPATTSRPDGARIWQQHLLGSIAACAPVTRWRGCAVANAGQVRMRGENIERHTSAGVVVVQLGVRAGFTQHLGRWAFVNAHADGLVNLIRWTGSLDQIPVWTAPPLAAMFGLDAGVQLP